MRQPFSDFDDVVDSFEGRPYDIFVYVKSVALRLISLKGEITADDVYLATVHNLPPDTDMRVVGSALTALARKRYIRSTGRRVRSELKHRHGRKLEVWCRSE